MPLAAIGAGISLFNQIRGGGGGGGRSGGGNGAAAPEFNLGNVPEAVRAQTAQANAQGMSAIRDITGDAVEVENNARMDLAMMSVQRSITNAAAGQMVTAAQSIEQFMQRAFRA